MYRNSLIVLNVHPTNYGFRTYIKQLDFNDGDTALDTDKMMIVMAESNNTFS
jgi:hypothetical protein